MWVIVTQICLNACLVAAVLWFLNGQTDHKAAAWPARGSAHLCAVSAVAASYSWYGTEMCGALTFASTVSRRPQCIGVWPGAYYSTAHSIVVRNQSLLQNAELHAEASEASWRTTASSIPWRTSVLPYNTTFLAPIGLQESPPCAELSVGPLSVTRPNPTHRLTDPTKPNQSQRKFIILDPTNPTQPITKQQQTCGFARKSFIHLGLYKTFHIKHQLNN